MKRLIGLFMGMVVVLSGCVSANASGYRSDPEVVEDALALVERMDQAEDIETFSECFVDATSEQIQQYYDALNFSDYPRSYGKVIYRDPDSGEYAVSVVRYYVTGQHPNTHSGNLSMAIVVKYVDGQPYASLNQEAFDKINAKLKEEEVYPKEMIEAEAQGRNSVVFNESNFMFIDYEVYENCLYNEVKFAWQDAEGKTHVSILFQNGTDQDIYLKDGELTITSDSLGTLMDERVNIEDVLPAHEAMIITWTFDSVTNEAWGPVQSHTDIDFN